MIHERFDSFIEERLKELKFKRISHVGLDSFSHWYQRGDFAVGVKEIIGCIKYHITIAYLRNHPIILAEVPIDDVGFDLELVLEGIMDQDLFPLCIRIGWMRDILSAYYRGMGSLPMTLQVGEQSQGTW